MIVNWNVIEDMYIFAYYATKTITQAIFIEQFVYNTYGEYALKEKHSVTDRCKLR